jgi:uncharacterized MAPEG superfamily protein
MDNPILIAYLISASLIIIKMMGHGWLTVYRMMKIGGGFLNPEDAAGGLANPKPRAGQLDPDDYVERARRMHRNESENVPPFLVAGLLLVMVHPPVWLAQVLLYGFLATRLGHFWAYVTAKPHEVRAFFFTIGSLIVIGISGYTLVSAIL